MTSPSRERTRRLARIAVILFALMLLGSLATTRLLPDDPLFAAEARPFFLAWFGFGACVVVALVAKFLGLFLQRREEYYESQEEKRP